MSNLSNTDRINHLFNNKDLSDDDFIFLLQGVSDSEREYLYSLARKNQQKYYGNDIYIRGLIEFTNYCRNDCLYCGIRKSNARADRYRLGMDEILSCASEGYRLGFRTFVLQGGEDMSYSDSDICRIVSEIKIKYPDCGVTLSIGERSYQSYKAYFDAGADRYLLRHESADEEHYKKLHPTTMLLSNRKECLYNLKQIGYQVGCGIMVGSPYQSEQSVLQDIRFMQQLKPNMIGIGPFVPHKDTPFAHHKTGELTKVLDLLAIVRLIFPSVLLPATTALGTIDAQGREKGIMSGANVLMPNLSPKEVRNKYTLYDNKICTGEEAAECIGCLEGRVKKIGYNIVEDIGNYKPE